MPEIRKYVVMQTREVEVSANKPEDAVRIAVAAFKDDDTPTDIWGHATSPIREIEIISKEKRFNE